jgi:hypothetical protein
VGNTYDKGESNAISTTAKARQNFQVATVNAALECQLITLDCQPVESNEKCSPHPQQNGFTNAGDAWPSHWRPLTDQIFRALEAAAVTESK